MGANMARRLKDKQYQITAVYDINRDRAGELAMELACEAANRPAQVAARSNILFTVVSDDAAMRQIYNANDPDGLLRHATDRLFINCATLSPAVHEEVQALVERAGGQSLEACMASSITQAREGTLYLMCGGRLQAFERAKLLLQDLSVQLRYIGPAGEAARSKRW
jgi:3-hydroxyisobutyrate dehydrogenase-like beta-hydroxyacid dehydrogenase